MPSVREGDIVRLFNEVGAGLTSAHLSADMREDVVQLPTGAWYDPVVDSEGRPMSAHGNSNVLTRDIGTSPLAQDCAGQLSTVQIERYEGAVPLIRVHEPPVAAACRRDWRSQS